MEIELRICYWKNEQCQNMYMVGRKEAGDKNGVYMESAYFH